MSSRKKPRTHSGRIEALAVAAVKNAINMYPGLQGNLREGDTTVSYDGGITVYAGPVWEKRACLGFVPVQIKGTIRQIRQQKSQIYRVQTADLEVFARNMGVLYFVVEIDADENTIIYYSQLLPVDLQQLLSSRALDQKTIALELRPLSYEEHLSLSIVCQNFLIERPKQVGRTMLVSQLADTVEEVEFQITTERNSHMRYMLETDVYMYGRRDGRGDLEPISRAQITAIETLIDKPVLIGDKAYFHRYRIRKEKDRTIIRCGTGIFCDIEGHKVNLRPRGTLAERIQDLEFFTALMQSGVAQVGDGSFHLAERPKPDQESYDLASYLQQLKDFHSTLSLMGVSLDGEFADVKDNELKTLAALTESVIYGRAHFAPTIKTGLRGVTIRGCRFAIFVHAETSSDVKICNYFGDLSRFTFSMVDSEGQSHENISPHITLTSTDILTLKNFDAEAVWESISRSSLDIVVANHLNAFLLEVVRAYDADRTRDDIYGLATSIAERLVEYDNYSPIYCINRLQVIRRQRDLNRDEKALLAEMRAANSDDLAVQCGISILLQNRYEFERHFDMLTEEAKAEFRGYPIYSLAHL